MANVKTDITIVKIDRDKTSVFLLNFEEKKKRKKTNKITNRKIKALIIKKKILC